MIFKLEKEEVLWCFKNIDGNLDGWKCFSVE
jgi:hypothetical protein